MRTSFFITITLLCLSDAFKILDNKNGIANSNSILIAAYSYSGQMNKALAAAEEAILIYHKYKFKKKTVPAYYNLSMILKGMGRLEDALAKLLQAI